MIQMQYILKQSTAADKKFLASCCAFYVGA